MNGGMAHRNSIDSTGDTSVVSPSATVTAKDSGPEFPRIVEILIGSRHRCSKYLVSRLGGVLDTWYIFLVVLLYAHSMEHFIAGILT